MARKKKSASFRKRSAAAKKGWITRLAKKAKRSLAAKKGWATRRRKKGIDGERRKTPKEKNREYLLTVERRAKHKKKKTESPLPDKSRLPDLLTIFDADASETAVVAFTIAWLGEKGKAWQGRIIQHAWQTGRLLVASGPLTSKGKSVSYR